MIQPTKIHLAISNCTGTAQSSPHLWAIDVVHYQVSQNPPHRFPSIEKQSSRETSSDERRVEKLTCSEEIMVTATKISRPYTVRDLKNNAYRKTYLHRQLRLYAYHPPLLVYDRKVIEEKSERGERTDFKRVRKSVLWKSRILMKSNYTSAQHTPSTRTGARAM